MAVDTVVAELTYNLHGGIFATVGGVTYDSFGGNCFLNYGTDEDRELVEDDPGTDESCIAEMRCLRACLEAEGATHVVTDEDEYDGITEPRTMDEFFGEIGHPMAPDGSFVTGAKAALEEVLEEN